MNAPCQDAGQTLRAVCILFAAFAVVFGLKYWLDYRERASAMALNNGPFAPFEMTADFPDVPATTAAMVRTGDEMRVRSYRLARVVEKDYTRENGSTGTLQLRIESPNWLRYYFEPLPGTEVVFVTDTYSLTGLIQRSHL